MQIELYDDVVKKLIGSIEPIGETNTDNKRLDNLNTHMHILYELISDLLEVAKYKNRPEYSMSKLGKIVYDELLNIKEWVEEAVE